MNRNIIALHKRLAQVGDQIRLLDVELESPSILSSADLIAIGGGNPYYLLYWLRRSGADEIIQQSARQGTPIMATSAGAIVLGQSLELIDHFTPEMNSVQLTDYSGLRLIEETVLPHYDRFIKNGTIKESAVSDYEKRSGVKVIRLNDDQFYLVGDGLPPPI